MKVVIPIATMLCDGLAHSHSGGSDRQGCRVGHKVGIRLPVRRQGSVVLERQKDVRAIV